MNWTCSVVAYSYQGEIVIAVFFFETEIVIILHLGIFDKTSVIWLLF
jgi:hypothetical protein